MVRTGVVAVAMLVGVAGFGSGAWAQSRPAPRTHSSDEDRLASTTNTHSRDGSYTNLTSAARQWERKYGVFNFKQSTWSLLLQRRSQWPR